MLSDFELQRPDTVTDALAAIAEGGTPYVGGTELLAAMQIGLFAPPVLVDLKRVGELRGIEDVDGSLRIGAATRHREVAASALVRRETPILAEACSLLGNQRVRATGSIGGNVCFADHRSDVVTALVALHATAHLRSAEAVRTVAVEDLVLGAMDVDREPDELLVAIEVPCDRREQIYLRHQPAEYPTVCVAVLRDADQGSSAVEVVIGAAVDRPQRFRFASIDDVDPGGIAGQAETVEDLNGSQEYKQHLVSVFVRRATEKMRDRFG